VGEGSATVAIEQFYSGFAHPVPAGGGGGGGGGIRGEEKTPRRAVPNAGYHSLPIHAFTPWNTREGNKRHRLLFLLPPPAARLIAQVSVTNDLETRPAQEVGRFAFLVVEHHTFCQHIGFNKGAHAVYLSY